MDDAKAIIAAARSAGVKLGVGYLLRFDPRYARAKEMIDEGKIGHPIHVYARRNSARTEGPKRYAGKLPLPLHVTVHDVDLVLWMLRRTASRLRLRAADGHAARLDRHPGQHRRHRALFRRHGRQLRKRVVAAVRRPAHDRCENGADRHRRLVRSPVRRQRALFRRQFPIPARSTRSIGQRSAARWAAISRQQLHGVLEWLDGVDHPIASGDEALRSLELTLAMIRSAETGEVVHLA